MGKISNRDVEKSVMEQQTILYLLGIIQGLMGAIIWRLFSTNDKQFVLISNTRKALEVKLEKLEKEFTELLDKHYVTKGMHTTLEERVLGKLDLLTMSIDNLTDKLDKGK